MSRKEASGLKQRAADDLRVVEEILREWDPIGVIEDLIAAGHPPDEYSSYAPGIYALLRRGCDAEELGAHLSRIQSENMGLVPVRERDLSMARRLVDWWQARRMMT